LSLFQKLSLNLCHWPTCLLWLQCDTRHNVKYHEAKIYQQFDGHPFLGAFEKLRIASSSLPHCQPVRPRGGTRPPLDRFSLHLIFECYLRNLSRKFKFHQNLIKINRTLHEYICTFMIYRSIRLRMESVSEKKL
jgi:hypothetical protein